ncbi:MAG: DUF5723 family protein [Candidatus Symbiothrix sp.]|jgi:hypothetical protein|nr:DUF5723 family protein [Candidatus Symbiothrix sp.]
MNHIQFFNNKKTFLFILGICFSLHSVLGQSTNTEYFMKSSFTSASINPAKRPEKGYIGIPGLTNVMIDYKTNTFGLENFLFPGLGESGKSAWFLNKNVSYDSFMKNISNQNYLNLDVDYTPIGFGFYTGDLFLSFDVALKTNAQVNIPKNVFEFVKKGVPLGESAEGESYDFSKIGASVNAYTEIGFGGSYPLLNNSLVAGAKVKILLGVGNARVKLDRMLLNIDKYNWSLETEASGRIIGLPATYNEDGHFDGFDTDNFSFGINGFGLGLDLGATFEPGKLFEFLGDMAFMDNITFSAALTDIGFISWSDKNAAYLATDPSKIHITGEHNISFEDDSDNSLGSIIDNLADDFNDAIALKEDPEAAMKKSSGIGASLNWGAEYALLDKKLNVGFLSTTHFNTLKTITEFTLAGAYRPASAVEVGLSYSVVHSHFKTIGLALHLGPAFYIASDYVIPTKFNSDFIPVSARAFNLQFGFVVPIGKKR